MQARIAPAFLEAATRLVDRLSIVVVPNRVRIQAMSARTSGTNVWFDSDVYCPCCDYVAHHHDIVDNAILSSMKEAVRSHLICCHSLEEIQEALMVKLMES
jgi:hypothetical protein